MKKLYCSVLLIFLFFLVGCGSKESTSYKITWNDESGNLILITDVKEGVKRSYTYNVSDTAEWDYTFKGWSDSLSGDVIDLPVASSDATYYAVVDKVKQKYEVSFVTNSDSKIDSVEVIYNNTLSKPDDPVKEGFHFAGWCSDSSLENAVEWPITVTKDITLYASWNEKLDIASYLVDLLSVDDINPYSYIPASMKPGYSANLVNANSQLDYSNFVQTSSIIGNGMGEQWHMVCDNLEQSNLFFNALTVVEGLATTSVSAFNNYLDKNPSNEATYNFDSGIYNVTISFDEQELSYDLSYTTTLPVIGEQTAKIKLALDLESNKKTVRIEFGSANVLEYQLEENSYTFAIKYAGIRKASFVVKRNSDNSVEGYINELLTVAGVEIASSADFYINDTYLSVVGNKAGSMTGFKGYISELYSSKTGKLISYEVREELSSIVYNTLWVDLSSVNGITSIKYQEKTDSDDECFYINNSNTSWETKKVGGLGLKMASRRFDIEFRTQYFYTYDSINQEYNEVALNVPMLFIQEEYYSSFSSDCLSVNNVNASVTLSTSDLNKQLNDYDTLIDIYINNNHSLIEVK